jgi:hypothetical protein
MQNPSRAAAWLTNAATSRIIWRFLSGSPYRTRRAWTASPRYSGSRKRRIQQRLVFTVRDPLAGAVLWGEAEVKP